MKELQIYDNGGKTIDRYTVIMPQWTEFGRPYFALSENAYTVNDCAGYLQDSARNYNKFGKKIPFDSAPIAVKNAVIAKLIHHANFLRDARHGIVELYGCFLCFFDDGRFVVRDKCDNTKVRAVPMHELLKAITITYDKEGDGVTEPIEVPIWTAIANYGVIAKRIKINKVRYRLVDKVNKQILKK